METTRAFVSAALVGAVFVLLAAAVSHSPPAPAAGWPELAAFAVLGALAAAASLHRPLGGAGLGAGAAAVPLAARLFGGAAAAWMALGAALAGEAVARRLAARRRDAPPERRGGLRLLEGGARAGLASLCGAGALLAFPAAGAPATAGARLAGAGAAAILVYVLGAAGFDLAVGALRREAGAWGRALAPALLPALVEAGGLAAGILLLPVHDRIGLGTAALLLAALAALGSEAARQARRHGRSELQAEELRQVGRAAQRVVAGGQPLRSIAEQIRVECRNLLPFVWYEFELGEARWSAGPDGVLEEGDACPDPAPPPLPGVHRRGTWEVVEGDLRVEGEVLARVRLWCDPRRVEPAARQLLEELLPQMAASVHRALLDREAKHDALTGVASRRVLDDRLQAAFRRACEDGGAMAVILCDLDHFKRINDTYGHEAGDRALVAVAQMLDERRRDEDLLCRYGGEEFTLLVERSDGPTALQLAERLRLAVDGLRFEAGGHRVPLTLSAGVAAFPELHAKTGSELVLLADAALYRAKQAGRNRSLLNRGGGRYTDASGALVKTGRTEKRRPVEPPQIFV